MLSTKLKCIAVAAVVAIIVGVDIIGWRFVVVYLVDGFLFSSMFMYEMATFKVPVIISSASCRSGEESKYDYG